ncbi:hypothetical protein [Pseudomonas sp. BMS12]|uniref:hypothetical protein n=1 Tax=Pseudomonas sp. BMS12 TaxID=1796033 RepID=UPI00083B0481|nr:hypothetical protein [Pseudomonas sp. BMS12]
MLHAVLIETNLDEPALRRCLGAPDAPREWRLEAQGGRWLLWLDESEASARQCGALLACAGVRRLAFVGSAG